MKLIRAQEHFESILEILRGFTHGQCEITPEKDSQRNTLLLRVRLPKPPLRLSLILGDFFFNVRSALDHIVWQLVLANPPNQPKRRNAFPICTQPDNFAEEVRRHRLDGVPKKAQALIETLQPYADRDNALRMLDELHNVDKHQTLHFTTAVAESAFVDWSRGSQTFLQSLIGTTELRDGAIFGNLELSLDTPRIAVQFAARLNDVKMQGEAAIFVAFDNPAAETLEDFRVDTTLENILEFVRDIVFPTFEPFFD